MELCGVEEQEAGTGIKFTWEETINGKEYQTHCIICVDLGEIDDDTLRLFIESVEKQFAEKRKELNK